MSEETTKLTCEQCGVEVEGKTLPAAKARLTVHKKGHNQVKEESTNEAASGGVTEPSEEDKSVANLSDQVNHLTNLVTELTRQRNEDKREKAFLLDQIKRNDEVSNPGAGPGPACEAYLVHRGEALQLKSTEDGGYEPVPNGFKVKSVDGMPFVVKESHPDNAPVVEGMIANCRSLYTEAYSYLLPKKPGEMTRQSSKAHLCRKHARILLGIPEGQKASGVNEVK